MDDYKTDERLLALAKAVDALIRSRHSDPRYSPYSEVGDMIREMTWEQSQEGQDQQSAMEGGPDLL